MGAPPGRGARPARSPMRRSVCDGSMTTARARRSHVTGDSAGVRIDDRAVRALVSMGGCLAAGSDGAFVRRDRGGSIRRRIVIGVFAEPLRRNGFLHRMTVNVMS